MPGEPNNPRGPPWGGGGGGKAPLRGGGGGGNAPVGGEGEVRKAEEMEEEEEEEEDEEAAGAGLSVAEEASTEGGWDLWKTSGEPKDVPRAVSESDGVNGVNGPTAAGGMNMGEIESNG